MTTLDWPTSPASGDKYNGFVWNSVDGTWDKDNVAASGYLLGAIYPWTGAVIPAWGLELAGQTIVGGVATYSGIAALNPAWCVGSDLVLPDWRERTPAGYKVGSSTHGVLGALVGSLTHAHTGGGLVAAIFQGITKARSTITNWIATNTNNYTIPGASSTAQTVGVAVEGSTDAASSLPPEVVVRWIICAVSTAGNFDTTVQAALVSRVSALEVPKGWTKKTPSSVVVTGTGATFVQNLDGSVTVTNCLSITFSGVQPNDNTRRLRMFGTGILSVSGGYLYSALTQAGAIVGGSFWSGGLHYNQGTANGILQQSDIAGTPWIGYVSGGGDTPSDFEVEYLGSRAPRPRIHVLDSNYGSTNHTHLRGGYGLRANTLLNADGVYVTADNLFSGTFEFWELIR